MATANRTPVLFQFTVISARPGDWSPAALMVNHVIAEHPQGAACAALRAHAQADPGQHPACDYHVLLLCRGHFTDLTPLLHANWKAPLYKEATTVAEWDNDLDLAGPGEHWEVADEW